MKKLALAALAATTLLATPAAAQTNWTGFYVGANAGYADGESNQIGALSGRWTQTSGNPATPIVPASYTAEVNNFIDTQLSPNGVIFGGQVGFNYQIEGFVFGVEADYTKLNLEDVHVRTLTPSALPADADRIPGTFTATSAVDAKHMFTARGKIGAAFGDLLMYAHGGWAWVNVDFAAALSNNTAPPIYNKAGGTSSTEGGMIVGGGLEFMLTSQIGVRAEYSYVDLGGVDFFTAFQPGSSHTGFTPAFAENYRQEMTMHIFKFGVNFHF